MDIEVTGKNIYLKNKVVSKLDVFVLDFIDILKKYVEYVVISGYVSILFGRSRGTEDIDILIKKLDMEAFIKFYNELKGKNYWFLNAESPLELYSMLEEGLAIRIAAKDTVIPNIEVKFVKSDLDRTTLRECNTVEIGSVTFFAETIHMNIPSYL